MKRINGGSCGGSHPPLNSADSRAPLPPRGALETQLKAFKESGNGQNDLPFVVHEVKTPSLSLTHLYTRISMFGLQDINLQIPGNI